MLKKTKPWSSPFGAGDISASSKTVKRYLRRNRKQSGISGEGATDAEGQSVCTALQWGAGSGCRRAGRVHHIVVGAGSGCRRAGHVHRIAVGSWEWIQKGRACAPHCSGGARSGGRRAGCVHALQWGTESGCRRAGRVHCIAVGRREWMQKDRACAWHCSGALGVDAEARTVHWAWFRNWPGSDNHL